MANKIKAGPVVDILGVSKYLLALKKKKLFLQRKMEN